MSDEQSEDAGGGDLFFSIALGVLIPLLLVLIGYIIVHLEIWPRVTCHGIPPFGSRDYTCVLYIGR